MANEIDNDDAGDALPDDLQAEADALLNEIDQAPEQAKAIESSKLCSDLLQLTFNGLVAPRKGDHWKLTTDECDTLGKAYGAVLDKYFPDLDLGVEVTALVVSIAVFLPRIKADTKTADDQPTPAPGNAVFGVDDA